MGLGKDPGPGGFPHHLLGKSPPPLAQFSTYEVESVTAPPGPAHLAGHAAHTAEGRSLLCKTRLTSARH